MCLSSLALYNNVQVIHIYLYLSVYFTCIIILMSKLCVIIYVIKYCTVNASEQRTRITLDFNV